MPLKSGTHRSLRRSPAAFYLYLAFIGGEILGEIA